MPEHPTSCPPTTRSRNLLLALLFGLSDAVGCAPNADEPDTPTGAERRLWFQCSEGVDYLHEFETSWTRDGRPTWIVCATQTGAVCPQLSAWTEPTLGARILIPNPTFDCRLWGDAYYCDILARPTCGPEPGRGDGLCCYVAEVTPIMTIVD